MKARFFFYKRNKLKTIDMSKISYYTAEGLKKLKDELNHLKDVERPKASNAIAEARDKGDLSENAEYDAAKEAQGLLELKISKLEETLSNARLIDESQLDSSKVLVLSKVKIKNHLDNSLMLVTALAPHIGYDNAAKIAKTALKNSTTLKYETLKTGLIKEKDYNKIVNPKKMIYPA